MLRLVHGINEKIPQPCLANTKKFGGNTHEQKINRKGILYFSHK